MMLTSQVKRGWEIADRYRSKGGSRSSAAASEPCSTRNETLLHADSVFLGEAEGRMGKVFEDFKQGHLQARYDYLQDFLPIACVGPARDRS